MEYQWNLLLVPFADYRIDSHMINREIDANDKDNKLLIAPSAKVIEYF